jgi:endonuclease-3
MKIKKGTTSQNMIAIVIETLEQFQGIPHPKRERANPLDMLIGTLLSQNTNDKNSHQAYIQLRKKFPTWKKVAEAPVSQIAAAIKVGGMKNQKSRRIKKLLREVREQFGGYELKGIERWNNEKIMERLTSFDGIGYKTAACVLLFSLRREIFPVDTHIHRILNRLGIVHTKTPDKTFEAMQGKIPEGKSYSFHTNLIRFGRTVCLAQRPRCGVCPLFEECHFPEKEKFVFSKQTAGKRRDPNFMLLDEI